MARIAGVDLPPQKKIEIALTTIFGIGRQSAREIVRKAKVDGSIRSADLDAKAINDIRQVIDGEYTVEGDLRREVALSVKRLVDLGNYRGLRHRRGLPVRGQRTKTNSRTRRGNTRKTMGSGRKPATSPT